MSERGEYSARIGNLPQMPAPFIGRAKDVEAIAEFLADPASRLLTLVGPGGIGKSRLAVQVAAALGPRYRDGAWLVELDALCDPALVPQAAASTLGLQEVPGQPFLETLVVYLRPRHLVLVLDNCEHVLDACAQLARALLATCPDLCILATSREPLHVLGEVDWPVPPLSLPDLKQAAKPQDFLSYEAVQLFVDRAERVMPAFTITHRNAPAVAEICSRLDGLPLAIELAAAWVKVLSVAQINERLADRFRLLTGGGPAAPARHQTLEATLDWSYELLSEQEQVLFRRLAVFAGTFSLEAVETICTGEALEQDNVLRLLSNLVDKSLVMAVRIPGQARRYRLSDTVRLYAADALRRADKLEAAGEAEMVAGRHLRWYTALVEQAEPYLWGSAKADSLHRLELEEDNFRVALQWALANARTEEGLRLAAALGWYWYVRAQLREGRRWLEQVLAMSEGASSLARTRALGAAGSLTLLQGDHEQAIAFLEEALALTRGQGHRTLVAWDLQSLGLAHLFGGEYARAEARFAESISLFREVGDTGGTATVLLHQGILACHQGDYGRADGLLQVALPMLRELGDAVGIARALVGLGLVARHRARLEEAKAFYSEALQVACEMGARLDIAQAMEGLGGVACAQGQPRRAVCLFGAAEARRQTIGTGLPTGALLDRTQDLEAARARLDKSTFEAAWDAGRALTLDQALDYALADTEGAEPADVEDQADAEPLSLTPLQAAKQRYGGLTRRERQVTALVAQGMSNAEIAEELVVTLRTVESHVTHILSKLGFSSRSQLAAWAIGRGLAPVPRTLEERMRGQDGPEPG